MAIKKVRVNCGKCKTRFIAPFTELPLHIAEIDGEHVILCPKCCKEKYWFEADRCNQCSERTMCKGLFLTNLKEHVDKINGI